MVIKFHRKFDKYYSKLPNNIKESFIDRLQIFKNNNFSTILNNHSVAEVYHEARSINITGDCRALYRVEDDCIVFFKIGTHSQLYK